jgi:hypothetical protein
VLDTQKLLPSIHVCHRQMEELTLIKLRRIEQLTRKETNYLRQEPKP